MSQGTTVPCETRERNSWIAGAKPWTYACWSTTKSRWPSETSRRSSGSRSKPPPWTPFALSEALDHRADGERPGSVDRHEPPARGLPSAASISCCCADGPVSRTTFGDGLFEARDDASRRRPASEQRAPARSSTPPPWARGARPLPPRSAGRIRILTDEGDPPVPPSTLKATTGIPAWRAAARPGGTRAVDDGDGDPVGLAIDRRAQRLHGLLDVPARRARPLHRALDERSRVLRAELGGDEERIDRVVADEDEPPARVRGEVAASAPASAPAGPSSCPSETPAAPSPARRRKPARSVIACSCSRRIRPTTPSAAAISETASSKRAAGMRLAMTGARSTSPVAEQVDDLAPDSSRVTDAADHLQVAKHEPIGRKRSSRPAPAMPRATTRPPSAADASPARSPAPRRRSRRPNRALPRADTRPRRRRPRQPRDDVRARAPPRVPRTRRSRPA